MLFPYLEEINLLFITIYQIQGIQSGRFILGQFIIVTV